MALHLRRRDSGFHLRVIVPLAIRPALGCREIIRALPGDRKHASRISRIVAAWLSHLFDRVGLGKVEMDEAGVRALVDRWVREALDEDAEDRLHRCPMDPDEVADAIEIAKDLRCDYARAHGASDWTEARRDADEMAAAAGIAKGSREYQLLCREVLRGYVTLLSAEIARYQGDDAELPGRYVLPNDTLPEALSGHVPRAEGPSLRSAIESYLSDRPTRGSWTPKTAEAFRAACGLLVEIVGDKPVGALSFEDASAFVATLRRVPANRVKRADTRGKTLAEACALVDTGKLPPVSLTTIKNNCAKVAAFGAWATKRGMMPRNVLAGLVEERRKVREDEERPPFTPVEIERLFAAVGRFRKPWQRWVPVLCLYTGARLNELCQLRTADVQEQDGVAYLEITDKAGRLKNLASRRQVPLHPMLLKMGFMDHVSHRRGVHADRLWDLPERRDGFAADVTRWWNRTRRTLGIGVPLHSARHTFATALSDAGIPQEDISTLLGHSRGKGETVRYCKAKRPATLRSVVEKLRYPGQEALCPPT